MSNLPVQQAFGPEHAEVYDRQFERLGAIKDALMLLAQAHLLKLPSEARILAAGAGTGAEVRWLARAFPSWRFTLVDPSVHMLAVARRHAAAEGFAERCTFHESYVASLDDAGFDAATSVLVSHFLTDVGARRAYFTDIAARLQPGGLLFNADLCADQADVAFETLMAIWLRMLEFGVGLTEEKQTAYRAMFGRDFAAQGPDEFEALLSQAGFVAPVQCGQVALIRAWVSRRA